MATTTTIKLTEEQIQNIARNLRVDESSIPDSISIVAISPEAGLSMGLPEDMQSKFAPALIIT
jgi:hypothetical protein